MKLALFKYIKILITPSYEFTKNSIDLLEVNYYDSDSVLFQQGYDMGIMDVEAGEIFEIMMIMKVISIVKKLNKNS